MKILSSYSDLAPAFKEGGECAVKGIDWETRYIRPYRIAQIIKLPICLVRQVSTMIHSCISLPGYKFLVNPLPYPFLIIELQHLRRLTLEDMTNQHPIAVAPMAPVSNNPFYKNSGIISDHVISFSKVRSVRPMPMQDIYDIVLAEGDNYILNNVVRVL